MKDYAYLRLRSQWYEKIKITGFRDIEDVSSPNEYLKTWHSTYFSRRYCPISFEAERQFFELAQDFLTVYKFKNSKERLVWELTVEGLSQRQVAKKTKQKLCQVHLIVKRLKEEMLSRMRENFTRTG